MYVITFKYGRLCNRLFLASHILASATSNRQLFVNLAFYEYAHWFEHTSNDLLCRYPPRVFMAGTHGYVGPLLYAIATFWSFIVGRLQRFGGKLPGMRVLGDRGREKQLICLDDVLRPVHAEQESRELVFFQGWSLRGMKALGEHADVVRKYFTPNALTRERVNALLKQLRASEYTILVGVVIRHGDYRLHANGRYFYPLAKYKALMVELLSLFPGRDVQFFVCSDEEQNLAGFENFRVFFRSGHPVENLYTLAGCDYIISPPSTYGMWASFYGAKPLRLVSGLSDNIRALDEFQVCQG